MTTSRGHHAPGRATGHQELLYDPELPALSHAERARTLVTARRVATLCTLAIEPPGHPYGSLVTYGVHEGAPVLLISGLAEHTKNLRADARGSLLIAESDGDNPLALGRVTLLGHFAEVVGEARGAAVDAYVEANPSSRGYADFGDFGLWRLEVESLRFIGGFGRMSWVAAEDWRRAEPDPVAAFAEGIRAHMNQDHAEALVLYCRAFSRAAAVESAVLTQVDRYGFEMSAQTPDGARPIRVAFSRPVKSSDEVRGEMVALVRRAREQLGIPPKGH